MNEEKIIKGYKVFNKNLVNRYNFKFQVDKTYEILGKLKYGNNGFHFVKNLEDGLRYFDAFNNDIDIAYVESQGEVVEYVDDYYGYYNLYVTSKLKILKLLKREEIINIMLNTDVYRIIRFIQGFKLKKPEIDLILNYFPYDLVLTNIEYFQFNDKEAFVKRKEF